MNKRAFLFRALLLPFFLGCLAFTEVGANNIQVTNAALVGNTGTSAQIQFDLSWENSWRGGGVANWDAAWIFVKYRSSGIWQHALLSNTGHTAAAGSTIDLGLLTPGTAYNATANPAIGVFVYRNADGNGTLTLNGMQLRWDFGTQGLWYNDISQVQVFAIEMVYMNQGAFYVGSGGTESNSLTDGAWVSGASIPKQITSEAALTIATGAGNLWGTATSGAGTIGPTGSLPAAFPKGYAAFYSMKYEVSQQSYVDFLNTLTYAQQVTRTANAPNSVAGTAALITGNTDRNGIDIQVPGTASTIPGIYACNLDGDTDYDEPTDGRGIACNFLSWGDLSAYLDWSGLRPMTELEYEKACRGTMYPVANEYPWGTTTLATPQYAMINSGAVTEVITTGYSTTVGNSNHNVTTPAIGGPVRVGAFAGSPGNAGRITAGAGYYGAMELGGNIYEKFISVGVVEGRAYTGIHGNGVLTSTGQPDVANWPLPAIPTGIGPRGGAYSNTATLMRVSDRFVASQGGSNRDNNGGGRGARSAP